MTNQAEMTQAMSNMSGMSPGMMVTIHICIIIEVALGTIPAILAWRTSRRNRTTVKNSERMLKSMNGNGH